ncbi:MAG: rhomboid family intramembrane serine protease [archaeon]
MKKNKRSNKRALALTVVFAVAIVLAYFFFSRALLYIPSQPLIEYGFSFSNVLPGVITYSFLHVSPMHLIGNLLLFIPVGLIAEKKLRAKDFIAIYFLSAGVAAVTFSLIVPETVLVGASAAVSDLISAAFMVDIKKAFVAVIASSLVIMLVSSHVMAATSAEYEKLKQRSVGLEQKLAEISKNLTRAIAANNTTEVIYYSEAKNKTAQDYGKVKISETNLEIGLIREKEVRSSPWVHLAGALTGFAYLFVFRRDVIWEMPSQVLSLKCLRRS